jgi:serine/threonine protein kinase
MATRGECGLSIWDFGNESFKGLERSAVYHVNLVELLLCHFLKATKLVDTTSSRSLARAAWEVYRTTDTKLGREILRWLWTRIVSAAFRTKRAPRAALNHPNVVTLYSVEQSEGVHFLTMELVEGTSLDLVIPRDGLPEERIMEIAGALAEALAASHEKGIVHRDKKAGGHFCRRHTLPRQAIDG